MKFNVVVATRKYNLRVKFPVKETRVKFHFLENDETTKDMTWFLIGDNEAKAKCRFFVASVDNFNISVESQLRKSPNIFFCLQ